SELAPDAKCYCIPIVRFIPGRLAPLSGRSGVLFVGGFGHQPNIDAVNFLCNEIWPRIRAKIPSEILYIVGAKPPAAIQAYHSPENGIHVLGFVQDIQKLYKTIRVNVAPLRYGAGLKGKVVVSMGVGLPTVATSIAVEGAGLENGFGVLVE